MHLRGVYISSEIHLLQWIESSLDTCLSWTSLIWMWELFSSTVLIHSLFFMNFIMNVRIIQFNCSHSFIVLYELHYSLVIGQHSDSLPFHWTFQVWLFELIQSTDLIDISLRLVWVQGQYMWPLYQVVFRFDYLKLV